MHLELARQMMVHRQLRPAGVTNLSLLAFMGMLPREIFVPPAYAAVAYSDADLPLRNGRVLWSPAMIGRACTALRIQSTDTVLEIGAGTGYVTALLAHCAAHIFSLESDRALLDIAKKNIQQYGKPSVVLHGMDGHAGWPAHAPYDVIWVGGACHQFPEYLIPQLCVGGRLLVVVGKAPAMQVLLYQKMTETTSQCTVLFETVVPYLPGSVPTTSHFEL